MAWNWTYKNGQYGWFDETGRFGGSGAKPPEATTAAPASSGTSGGTGGGVSGVIGNVFGAARDAIAASAPSWGGSTSTGAGGSTGATAAPARTATPGWDRTLGAENPEAPGTYLPGSGPSAGTGTSRPRAAPKVFTPPAATSTSTSNPSSPGATSGALTGESPGMSTYGTHTSTPNTTAFTASPLWQSFLGSQPGQSSAPAVSSTPGVSSVDSSMKLEPAASYVGGQPNIGPVSSGGGTGTPTPATPTPGMPTPEEVQASLAKLAAMVPRSAARVEEDIDYLQDESPTLALVDPLANDLAANPGTGEIQGAETVEGLDAPTATANLATDPNFDMPGTVAGTGTSSVDNEQQIAANYNAINNAEGWFGDAAGGLRGPGYTEGLAGQWDPNRLTYSEEFLTGENGLDQMFQRMYDKGALANENRAAASGNFNSGAAMRLDQELAADIAAARVQKQMELSGQADEARVRNSAEGRQLMMGADQGKVDRLMAGGQLGRYADLGAEGRAEGIRGTARDASDSKLATKRLGLDATMGGDDLELRRRGLQFDVAKDSQLLKEGRYKTAAGLMETGEGMAVDRRKAAADVGLKLTDLGLSASKTLLDDMFRREELTLDQTVQIGQLAIQLDQLGLQKAQVDAIIAKTLQDMKLDWEQAPFDIALKAGDRLAAAAIPGLDAATGEQVDGIMAEITTKIAKYGVDRDGAYADADRFLQSIGQGGNVVLQAYMQKRIEAAISARGAK